MLLHNMDIFRALKVKSSAWRWPLLILCGGFGGCASVADGLNGVSLVGGVVSVELTGKGLTDHAVSLASGQDCSFLRLFHRTEVCRPWVEIQSVDGNLVVPEVAASDEEYIVVGRFNDYHEAMAEARALQTSAPTLPHGIQTPRCTRSASDPTSSTNPQMCRRP